MRKLILIFSLIIGCGSSGPNEWSKEAIEVYLNGCRTNSNEMFCLCTLGRLQDEYTEEEMDELGLSINTGGPVPSKLIDIAQECSGLKKV